MNITENLISDIRSYSSRGFTQEEIHQLKRCVLDWLCVSWAGALVVGEKLNTFYYLSKEGKCSTFVSSGKTDLLTASFLNGFVAHVMELDDGHRFGMLHLGAPIISSMVALAQQEKLDFQHFAKGVISGYQVAITIAKKIQPHHKKCGFHATGTCGMIGVASAAALSMEFTDEQFQAALGAAVTHASGLLAAIDAPSSLKPYNIACAAEGGLRSAYIAKAGFIGPYDPIDGKRGFLKVFGPEMNVNLVSFDEVPEILNIYFKPYVSCRHCHAPAEAAIKLREKHIIPSDSICEILVKTYRLAINGHDNNTVDSVEAAKMSIPYCAAVSLLKGSCGLDSFSLELINDEKVKALTKIVKVVEDKELTLLSPEKRGAEVIVKTKDGFSYSEYVENPLGEPEHPMSDQMLEEKYWDMVSFAGVDNHVAAKMISNIWNLEVEFNHFLELL